MPKDTEAHVPERFRDEHEEHEYLRRFKKTWKRCFRPTRMEPLFEGVDLANYLVALGREEEARDLLHHLVDDAVFDGNFNIWTPVGCGIILLTRLNRIGGDPGARTAQLNRLIEHDYRVDVSRGEVSKHLAAHPGTIEEALDDTRKWGAHRISRYLMGLNYFRETAESGFPHSGSYDMDALDRSIESSYEALRAILR